MEKPSLLTEIRQHYKAGGVIAVLFFVAALIVQETMLDFVIYVLRGIWLYLAKILADISTSAQNYISLILMAIGFLILSVIVRRAQQNINKRFSEIEARHNESKEHEGLQIVDIYEHWVEQEKFKHINMILRNDHDAPLRIEAKVMPVKYRAFDSSKWQPTKYDHPVGFTWREWIFEPKKTETIRLAQAEKDSDDFFVHCSTNNPHRLKDVGDYMYRLNLDAKDENNNHFELHIDGFFRYYGGTQLKFKIQKETQ